MKKLCCFILSIIIMLSGCITAFGAEAERGRINISINKNDVKEDESAKYGINLDGLTSANMVENGSFENKDNGWIFPSSDYTYGTADCINENNPTYNVVTANGNYILKNHGKDAMSFINKEEYEFSCYVRNIDFGGVISVWLTSNKNALNITKLSTAGISKSSWTRISADITSVETETGELAIQFEGEGSIELDCVSLVPKNSYGFENENYRNIGIRQDFFNALQYVNPDFITFTLPNGSWKNSIGDLSERDSFELGFHELMSLCYDLKANAVPVINTDGYDINSPEFVNFKQDILDMLEYANAPADTSYYGSLRAGNGTVEAFEIKYIQLIGQSNGLGDIKKAIEDKFNNVTVLAENDIAIIKNDERDMGATLDNAKQMIMANGFIMYGDTFNDFIKYSANSISYSPTYYSQMLISNNNGSNQIIENVSAFEHEMITTTATLNNAKNIISINFVNYNSSYMASIDLNGFSNVTTASIQYVYDGYTSAYNDIEKQYIAPKAEALEINGNHIEAEIPENSVCVIRITYNNAGENMLYSLPEQLNLKAKNYVPPAIIVILIALGVSFPIGLIAGNIIYKSKAKGRKKDE